jgi:hypothetical protein
MTRHAGWVLLIHDCQGNVLHNNISVLLPNWTREQHSKERWSRQRLLGRSFAAALAIGTNTLVTNSSIGEALLMSPWSTKDLI